MILPGKVLILYPINTKPRTSKGVVLPYFFEMLTDSIQQQIIEFVEGIKPGLFVVEVKLNQSKSSSLEVRVDTDKGISMAECVEVTRNLRRWLEEDTPLDFEVNVEVSSPGVGEPLLLNRQYLKNKGRDLRVSLLAGGQIEGRLTEVDENGITIFPYQTGKKLKKGQKPKLKEEGKVIDFKDIKESKVILSI